VCGVRIFRRAAFYARDVLIHRRAARLGRAVATWVAGDPDRLLRVCVLGLGAPLALASSVIALLSLPARRSVLVVVALLVAHAALVLLRSRPVVTLPAVAVAFAVIAAMTGMFLVFPSSVVIPVALYACAAYGSTAAGYAALGAGLAGAGGGAVRFVRDPSVVRAGAHPDTALLFGLLAVIVSAAWAAGTTRRAWLAARTAAAERDRLADLQRIRQRALQERTHLAREMHDIVAHSLAVMVTQAKGGQYDTRPGAATDALAVIEQTGRLAMTDMRALLAVLRADDTSSDQTPQPTLAELPGLLETVRAAGLPVDYVERGERGPLAAATELAVYRLVQEALTNTLRHAGDRAAARVSFDWSPHELVIGVVDNGTGLRRGRPPARDCRESGNASAPSTARCARAPERTAQASRSPPASPSETRSRPARHDDQCLPRR